MDTKNPNNDPNLAMSTPLQQNITAPGYFQSETMPNYRNYGNPPTQPSQEVESGKIGRAHEELVAFEKLQRDYEDYMASEDGPTANPDYIGLCQDLVPNSTNTILPISTNSMPFNSTPHHNILSTRESDAHAATAKILQEEISKQLHPLMEIINALKQEISSRLDTSTVNQNQLLI